MPTNKRLNISIVQESTINDLKELRRELQTIKKIESISYSEILRALLDTKPNSTYLSEYI